MNIEPWQAELTAGTIVDIVVEVGAVTDGRLQVRSKNNKKLFTTDIELSSTFDHTLFRMKVGEGTPMHLQRTWETTALEHQPWTPQMLGRAAELCSGLGAVTTGSDKCGVETVIHIEENGAFAEWLRRQISHRVRRLQSQCNV